MSAFPEAGSEFARYRLERLVARGGMGVVFEAVHVSLQRRVALKLLAPELAQDPEFRERFLREAEIAASLEHPNVVTVYDAGEERDLLYLAMRYLHGGDLREVLRKQGRLSLESTLSIAEQVSSALDEAHGLGLVHRDVKPANILFDERKERAYLADFGIARRHSTRGLTHTGSFLGTVDYCAPEQIDGVAIDGRADIYALGGVVFHCLTGQTPYVRETEMAVLSAHLRDAPPALSRVRPDLPQALDGVLVTAMAKYAEVRYKTAGAFASALRDAAVPAPETRAADHPPAPTPPVLTAPLKQTREHETGIPPPPMSSGESASFHEPAGRANRAWVVAALVAIALLIAIAGISAGVFFTRDPDEAGAGTQTSTAITTSGSTNPQPPSPPPIKPPPPPQPPPPPPPPSIPKVVSLTSGLIPPAAPYRCVSPYHRDHSERMGLQFRYSNGTRLQLVSEGPGDVSDPFLFCGGTSTHGIPGYASAPVTFDPGSPSTTVSSISGVFGGDFETGGLGRRIGLATEASGTRRCFAETDGEGHARRFRCSFPAGTRLSDVVLQLSVERDRRYGVFAGIAYLRATTKPA